jgi:tetratricopeptide (TPR) repeat protein
VWRVTLREPDGFEIAFRMTFAAAGSGWEAWSRQGAAREMVGGGTAMLGRMLGKMPPKEAVIHIGEGTMRREGTVTHLTGMLESPFLGRRKFVGTIDSDQLRAQLTHPSGAKAGTLEGARDSAAGAIRDYAALAADLEAAVRADLYDPSLLARREFVRFFGDVTKRFAAALDDLDVLVAFHALKPSLGVSHFDFIRNPRYAGYSLESILAGDASVDPATFVRLTFPAPEVAFLRITKWDRVGSHVDRAFERIASTKAQVLVLDIRGNPGGDASSIVPFTHLVRGRTLIGAFLARPWFDRAAGKRSPLTDLPVLDSNASAAQLIRDLRQHGGVSGVAVPRDPHFAGPVFLLVDGGTSSASEPLAHALKVAKRATLIGERTAGAMLTALPHALRDGWVVTIPQADFITADNRRLEGVGVEPDVKTDPNEVSFAVADRLPAALPFSAEVLRGGSHEALKRADEAERSFRAALRLADRQIPVPAPADRASVHKRLAKLRLGKGDRDGALREYGEVLKLVPDDAEALAAVRGG